jgi:hypothetical protein
MAHAAMYVESGVTCGIMPKFTPQIYLSALEVQEQAEVDA